MSALTMAKPISEADLKRITRDACDSALAPATHYDHAQTESWNSAIINGILSSILSVVSSSSSSSSPSDAPKPQHKYAVNSTIIQHISDTAGAAAAPAATASHSTGTSTSTGDQPTQVASPPTTPGGGAGDAAEGEGAGSVTAAAVGGSAVKPEAGRRGMHSATGAYWNSATDGMWSYKHEAGESKGMDVVISVIWMAV